MFLAVKMNAEYTCGGGDLVFSGSIPYIVSMLVTIIKIMVPVALVIFGFVDLLKSVIASKEDEIKKGQQTLIKRFIAAIIVFFVIQIVQTVIRFVAPNGKGEVNIANCFNCFINGTESDSACELK